MTSEAIQSKLFSLQDAGYRDFQSGLIPTVDKDCFIGVRTPALRQLAKALSRQEDVSAFLKELPHRYFDENQLHAFLLCEMKDFDTCMAALEAFLPYVDNWATCDQLSPKTFKKNREALLPYIDRWLQSEHTYTVRFAIKLLMQYFLDDAFSLTYAKTVAAVRSEEYYIKMMVAWYFATALAKQYEAALPFLEQHTLDDRTHRKTIQKATESYRLSPEQKAYLKTLKNKQEDRA